MPNAPVIKVNHLLKFYGAYKALDNLSFDIDEGSIVGFLGPNGAGKTTTLRILSGIIPASSGSVFFKGLPLSINGKIIRKNIGYMPENNPLPEDMRVSEYLTLRAKLKEIPSRQIKKAVDSSMEKCDLHRTASNKIIGKLSKGFRQRVGIADVLLANPSVAIFDEPTIGLDPHQILSIRQLLQSLKGKTTVIFSSHILPEIEASCSHLIIIDHGRIVATGTPQKLREEISIPTGYETTLQSSPEALVKLLSSFPPCKVYVKNAIPQTDGFFQYTLETDCQRLRTEQLTQFLIENHIPLKSFTLQEVSLEKLFLSLTQRPWKQSQ